MSLMAAQSNGKSVELFKDMLPSLRRVGILGHSTNPVFAKTMLDEVERAGAHVGVETKPVMMVRGPDELENAFATFVKDRVDAVVVQGSLAIKPVTDLAIKHRLPVSSTARAFAEIGGLFHSAPTVRPRFGTAQRLFTGSYRASNRKTCLWSSQQSSI